MLLLFDKFTLMMCFMVNTCFGGNRDGEEMALEKLKSVWKHGELSTSLRNSTGRGQAPPLWKLAHGFSQASLHGLSPVLIPTHVLSL